MDVQDFEGLDVEWTKLSKMISSDFEGNTVRFRVRATVWCSRLRVAQRGTGFGILGKRCKFVYITACERFETQGCKISLGFWFSLMAFRFTSMCCLRVR